MLSIFKKMFGKPEAKAPTPRVVAVPQAAAAEPTQARPQVEMAHLSLAAIVSKFPEDLRRNVARVPDSSVTVALPLATIHKQLPTGSVKMSLASLYRQAPAGVFTAARVEEKRMVEVPLSEVFRHVKPQALARKNEQRRVELPEGYELFGDKENPYTIAPTVPDEDDSASSAPAAPAAPAPRAVAPPSAFRPQAQPRVAPAPAVAARPAAPSVAAQPAASDEQEPVLVSLADLCGAWPEPFQSEAAALDGAQVALPVSAVSAGLARGKVTFTWGQIRAWLNPPPEYGTNGSESAELILPLKVLAPLFLTKARPVNRRRAMDMDESIPALFSGGNAAPAAPTPPPPAPEPEPAAPEPPALAVISPSPELKLAPPTVEPSESFQQEEAPAAEPAAEPVESFAPEPSEQESGVEAASEGAGPELATEPIEAPTLKLAPEPEIQLAPEPQPEPAPEPESQLSPEPSLQLAPAPELQLAPEPQPIAEPAFEQEPSPQATPEPQPAFAPVAEQQTATPQSVGELFGNPSKSHWSPPDLVRGTMGLPGVAGAVVALQEGLVVAAELPETMKGDTIAAFLPQMFARLNNYGGEMKLGTITDLLLTADDAPFQVFKLGEVYFAVLGKTGERLPGDSLRLIARELAGSNSQ